MSVRLSVTFGGGMAEETGRVDRKEGAMGRGDFYTFEGRVVGETWRVDRKEEGNGEGDFTDGWTYFSRAMPGHPASILMKLKVRRKRYTTGLC